MQQSELIGYTIEDNMKFPAEARNEAYDRDKAKQLISQVGLGNYQLDAQFEHMSGESNNVLPSHGNSCMNLKFYYWTKLLAL